MQTMSSTFLAQPLFSIKDPTPPSIIICLGCHFVMCTKYKSGLDIIIWDLQQLIPDIPNNIFHQSMFIPCHIREKACLSVVDNIRSFVAVII